MYGQYSNPWHVLGLPAGSPEEDVKKAFRAKALQHHPDRFVDPIDKAAHEEEFKRVNTAYQQITSERVVFDFGDFGINKQRPGTTRVTLEDLITIFMGVAVRMYTKK